MTATFRELAVSSSVMPRPLTMGVPMTSRYPPKLDPTQRSCHLSAQEQDVRPPKRQHPNRNLQASIDRERRKIRPGCSLSNRGCADKVWGADPIGNRLTEINVGNDAAVLSES